MSGFNIRNFARFVSKKLDQEVEIKAERIRAEFSRKLKTFVSNFDAFEHNFKSEEVEALKWFLDGIGMLNYTVEDVSWGNPKFRFYPMPETVYLRAYENGLYITFPKDQNIEIPWSPTYQDYADLLVYIEWLALFVAGNDKEDE